MDVGVEEACEGEEFLVMSRPDRRKGRARNVGAIQSTTRFSASRVFESAEGEGSEEGEDIRIDF